MAETDDERAYRDAWRVVIAKADKDPCYLCERIYDCEECGHNEQRLKRIYKGDKGKQWKE